MYQYLTQADLNKQLVNAIKSDDLITALDTVSILIKNGAEVNHMSAGNKGKMSMLMIAIDHMHHEMMDLLLEKGADPNVLSTSNVLSSVYTPIRRCVGQYSISDTEGPIRSLVKHGADIDMLLENGETVLTYAILREGNDLVSLLIELGADFNVGKKDLSDALHVASKVSNQPEIHAMLQEIVLKRSAVTEMGNQDSLTGTPEKRIRI